IDASGVSAPEPLIDLGRIQTAQGLPESVSPDGNTLTFRLFGLASDVMALRLDGTDRTPQPLVHTPAFEFNGVISPDGHWLAYTLSDQGSTAGQIQVRPYPNVDAHQWQVSSAPGGDIVWAKSSGELFFMNGQGAKMMGVTVAPG